VSTDHHTGGATIRSFLDLSTQRRFSATPSGWAGTTSAFDADADRICDLPTWDC
jgi:hypothetical protein